MTGLRFDRSITPRRSVGRLAGEMLLHPYLSLAEHALLPVYMPGVLETAWLGVEQEQVCGRIQRDAFSRAVSAWLAFSSRTQKANCSAPQLEPVPFGSLSRFVWPALHSKSQQCEEWIEPLTGMARHPQASGGGCWLRHAPKSVREVTVKQVSKYDTGHIVFANRCGAESACTGLAGQRFAAQSHAQPAARNLLFDLGCADYGRPMEKPKTMGGGIQPSLPLLQAIYRQGCIRFDGIWAWEARPKDPARWWKYVPNATRKVLRFTNRPVSLEGFFSALQQEARRDDFVVVKLDIDHPALEMAIVHEIAARKHLSSLIDELLFEYHVNLRMLSKSSTALAVQQATGMSNSTVREAVRLMQRLRERGIRSHFCESMLARTLVFTNSACFHMTALGHDRTCACRHRAFRVDS